MQLNLDLCADFLAESQYEHIIKSILQLSIGTWQPLHELIGINESCYEDAPIFVSWSHSLHNEIGFSLIIFCLEDSMEMITGTYNVHRLVGM